MKTKLLSNVVAFGILACFFLMPTHVKAQSPYPITNNTTCMLTISYTFYSWNGFTCGNVCSTGTINVPPSPPPTTIFKPAACNCGVQIDITHVNGVLLFSPISGTSGVPPYTPHGFGTTNCGPINLNVHPNTADMHP